ncbi:MAG TPA: energy transducer TonB [Terriglobales bacterium]|nr:energy transducer TonB [Terriglobales bacterium]
MNGSEEVGTGPQLLVELPSWRKVFLSNLGDFLLRRKPRSVVVTSPPAEFWPDVFVQRGIPWTRLRQSALLHIFVVVALWGLTESWAGLLWRRNPALPLHDKIVYYSVSEYLPPIDTGSAPAKEEKKGDPVYAKQPIISLPLHRDNREQTIITPPDVKLPKNVPLPNIVAWNSTPAPVPTAVATRANALTLPAMPASVIPPPPDPIRRELQRMAGLQPGKVAVIEPPPAIDQSKSTRKLDLPAVPVVEAPPSLDQLKTQSRQIAAPTPAVIEPPPAVDSGVRSLGAMNVGKFEANVAAPKLVVAEQRSVAVNGAPGKTGESAVRAAGGAGRGGSGQASAAVPPPPSIGALAAGSAAGQLIALNLHPATVSGPIEVPAGRRSGEFAATPQGKPDASGTPEIKGGGTKGANGGGTGTGKAEPGSGSSANAPAGIFVGGDPKSPPAGAAVVAGAPSATSAEKPEEKTLMASISRPKVTDTTRGPIIDGPGKIEDRVFSGRKYYTMALNMPNLTSSGGSWIVRFAQLQDDHRGGEVTAPIALQKVDPKYPPELQREFVEGTVTLYAVIRKDGSVDDVRVLRGVDRRLDENARTALARWHFHPGTKNGEAVDLEAVVFIPFKAGRMPF